MSPFGVSASVGGGVGGCDAESEDRGCEAEPESCLFVGEESVSSHGQPVRSSMSVTIARCAKWSFSRLGDVDGGVE